MVGVASKLPGSHNGRPPLFLNEPPNPRWEMTTSIFRIFDELVFPIYPISSAKLSPLRFCPSDDPDPIHCAFQGSIMSLSLSASGKEGESALCLMNSWAILKDARPQDNLLACITYMFLVLSSWIFIYK
jgi:hypothetical protein